MGRVKASIQFPFINLEKSVARAKQLYDADQRGNEMSVPTAFAVWGYSEKSSGGFQTISALKAYGLLEESGAGKVKLTKHAMDYFRDERDEHRAQRLQDFATNPPFLMDLFNHWGAHVPSDTVARSYLKIDRGMNEQSSRAVLNIYKENIALANVKGGAKIQAVEEEEEEEEEEMEAAPAKVRPAAPAQRIAHANLTGETRQEIFNLDEGPVILTFPASLSPESYQDLEDYLSLFLRKAKRNADAARLMREIATGKPEE